MMEYIFEKAVTFKISRTRNGCWNVETEDGGSSFGGKAVPLLSMIGTRLEFQIDGYKSDDDLEQMFQQWQRNEGLAPREERG